MTTGFRNASGVDFDSLFDPYVQGTSPAATGLRLSTGVDLAGRFAPITFGTKGPDVGFRTSGGVDVSNLWAAIGTAKYNNALVIPFGTYSETSHDSHDVEASSTLTFNRDGTFVIAQIALHAGAISGAPTSGNWVSGPTSTIGDGYQIRFTNAITIARNDYTGVDAYTITATTGFMDLSSARQIVVDTGHLLGGGANTGGRRFTGTFAIDIKLTSDPTGALKTSTYSIVADALIL